jgi:hypothetical protein
MGKALEITFHGPIAFRFQPEQAWAYIPVCDYHTCNITTDNNDISPLEKKTYTLTGAESGTTAIAGNIEIVTLDWNKVWDPHEQDCYSIFTFPPPDFIFGLQAEYVKIDLPAGPGWEGDYARGLRFRYNNSDAPKLSGYPELDATYSNGNDDLYHIEITYRDTNTGDGKDPFKDARECSLQMRKLLPPCEQWTVSFEKSELPISDKDASGRFGRIGPHPKDCGANVLALRDGVSL